jgi:hypothetical protein
LGDEIDRRLDAALADAPEDAKADREFLRGQLLAYFNEHGVIPDFKIGSAKDAVRGPPPPTAEG